MKLYKGTNPEMDSYSAFFDNIRSSGSTGTTEQCLVDFATTELRLTKVSLTMIFSIRRKILFSDQKTAILRQFPIIHFRFAETKIPHSALILAGLDVTLADAGIETVYVSGVATDFCVGYTAVDALSLGLTTFVVDDLIRGVADEGTDDDAIQKLEIEQGCAVTVYLLLP